MEMKRSENKSSILNHFWSLASVDSKVRESATKDLISHFEKLLPKNNQCLMTVDEIKTRTHQDISYSLKRLLKGLSSSRDGAREGFATCLTKLLEILDIDSELLVSLLFEISEKNGTKTGQEERELYYARIFGINAIALSGRFKESKLETIEKVATALVEYQVKKDYLRQAVSLVLFNLLVACKHNDDQSIAILTAYLKNGVTTPEQVWFVIKAKELGQQSLDALLLTEWKKADVLCLKNKTKLFDILFGATYHNNSLHPVYPTIIQSLADKNNTLSMSLFDFWAGIEDSYFSSSHDRKNMGFLIFEEILPKVNDQVALIFTPHFMRCLINSLSSKDAFLNPQAKMTASKLIQVSTSNPTIALPLVMQLVGKHGHYKFDQITKTKTVETILSNLTLSDIKIFLNYLQKSFINPEDINEDLQSQLGIRLWIVDQIYMLLRTTRIEKTKEWVLEAIEFLINYGVMKTDFVIPEQVRKSIRDKLISCMGYLSAVTLKDDESGVGKVDGVRFSFKILELITEKLKTTLLYEEFGQERSDAVALGFQTAKKIKKESENCDDPAKKKELEAFGSLFEHLTVMIYTDSKESIDVIQELVDCYDNMFKSSTTSSSKKRKAEEEEVPEAVEVLVDILISFLANPSAMLRSLASDVYKVFAPKSTPKVLDLFMDVLAVKAGVEGANELFEGETEVDDEGESSDSGSDSDSDDSVDDESTKDDQAPVDQELVAKIQAALGNDVEQDLEDLGDEEMEMFDNKLAEIFSQRKAMKTAKKETKETVLHFKLRVIDLLDIFLKSQTSKLFLDAVKPIVALYLDTASGEDEKVLHNKLGSLINSRISSKKDVIALEQADEALELLDQVHKWCARAADASSFNVINGVGLYLVKVISHVPELVVPITEKKSKKQKLEGKKASEQKTSLQKIADIYLDSFTKWMTLKNTRLRPNMFFDISIRAPLVAFTIIPGMIAETHRSKSPRAFQLVKAFEIIASAIKNLPGDVDEKGFVSVVEQFASSISDNLLNATLTGPQGISKDRFKNMLKSLGVVVRRCNSLIKEKTWDGSGLVKTLEALKEHQYVKKNGGFESIYLKSGKRKKILKSGDDENEVTSLSFSNDGKLLFGQTGGPEWNVHAWMVDNFKLLFTSKTALGTDSVGSISCNKYCSEVRLSVRGSFGIKVFKIQDDALKLTHHYKNELSVGPHCWVDAKRICIAAAGKLLVIDDNELVAEVNYDIKLLDEKEQPCGSTISPFHNGLLIGFRNGITMLFEKLDRYPYYQKKDERRLDTTSASSICWSDREDRAIISFESKNLFLFQIESDSKGDTLTAERVSSSVYNCRIVSMDAAISKPLLITAGEDKSIRAWNYISNKLECIHVFEEVPISVSIDPSGLHAIAAFPSSIKLVSIFKDKMVAFWENPIHSCKFVKFSNGGQFFGVITPVNVLIFNSYTMDKVYTLETLNARILGLVWAVDDSQLITFTSDGLIQCWDGYNFSLIYELNLNVAVKSISYGPKSSSILILLENGTVQELSDGRACSEVSLNGPVDNLCCSNYGSCVAFTTSDGSVRVSHFSNISEFTEYSYSAYSSAKILFSRKGRNLFSASDDGSIRVHTISGLEQPGYKSDNWEHSEEIIIPHAAVLEDELKLTALEEKLKEETLVAAQKVLLKDALYEQKLKAVQLRQGSEIESMKEEISDLQSQLADLLVKNQKEIETTRLENQAELNNLIESHSDKIKFEKGKFLALEEIGHKVRGQREEQRAIIEQSFLSEKEFLTLSFERTTAEIVGAMSLLREQAELERLKFEDEMQNLDEQVETEALELACAHEPKILEEKSRFPKVNDEHQDLTAKVAQKQREFEEIKKELAMLETQREDIQKNTLALESDIVEFKAEVQGRETTISDKDVQITDLKKKNQDLEKFKFVSDCKILELKKMNEPREAELISVKNEMKQAKEELKVIAKRKKDLQMQQREILMKTHGAKASWEGERKKYEYQTNQLSRMQDDLHSLFNFIHSKVEFKRKSLQFFHKYEKYDGSAESHSNPHEDNLDNRDDSEVRRREQLERALSHLKLVEAKKSASRTKFAERLALEGVLLTRELNGMRESFQKSVEKAASNTALPRI